MSARVDAVAGPPSIIQDRVRVGCIPRVAESDVCAACRLFNYGIGIHLIAGKPTCCPRELNPKDDHLSFQVTLGEGNDGFQGGEGQAHLIAAT